MTDVIDTGAIADPTASTGLEAALADPAAQAAIAKMFKVKIDGVESEVDEAELLRGYGHTKAANARMAAAQEQRQQAEEVLRVIKADPTKALSKLGVDVTQWAETILRTQMEDSMLSPQDKELRDLRKMATDLKNREQSAKEAQEQASMKAHEERVMQELEKDFTQALSLNDMPRNEFTVARMAWYMESSIAAGFANVRPQDVVPMVKDEYNREIKKLMADMEGDKLLAFLGDDISKKMIKAQIAKTGQKKNNKLEKPVTIERKEAVVSDAEKKAKEFKSFFGRK